MKLESCVFTSSAKRLYDISAFVLNTKLITLAYASDTLLKEIGMSWNSLYSSELLQMEFKTDCRVSGDNMKLWDNLFNSISEFEIRYPLFDKQIQDLYSIKVHENGLNHKILAIAREIGFTFFSKGAGLNEFGLVVYQEIIQKAEKLYNVTVNPNYLNETVYYDFSETEES